MPWLDGYEKVANVRNEGSAYAEPSYYPYRPVIFLHQTVSYQVSRSYVSGHTVPPHLWASPYNGDKFQTVRLDRAAFALYQPQFGYHWTNKHRLLLQTELVGVPVVSQATYTDDQCRWIAKHVIVPQVRWLNSIGESVDLTQVRYHTNTSGSASEYWPGRMSEQEMADFNGVMCHIDAWANDHWDCSAERIDLMARYAREILGGPFTPTPTPTPRRRKALRVSSTIRPGTGNGTDYVADITVPRAGDRVTCRLLNPGQGDTPTSIRVHWGSGLGPVYGPARLGDTGNGSGFDADAVRDLYDVWTAGHPGVCSVVSPKPVVLDLDPAG